MLSGQWGTAIVPAATGMVEGVDGRHGFRSSVALVATASQEENEGNADLFAFPPAHGCDAIFDARTALKIKESGNRVFAFRADDRQDGNSSASP
jgi:hypothetical protein